MLLPLVLLLFSNLSLAADLTASVNDTNLHTHDILHLTLTVNDATPNHEPDFSILEKHFSIYNKSNFSNITFINGKKTAAYGWNIKLIPTVLGQVIIPEFAIETDVGVLYSKPIVVKISKGSKAKQQKDAQEHKILIDVSINKKATYLHQPFVYTVKFITTAIPYNLQAAGLNISNAIIEQFGETKRYTDIYNGAQALVFETNYFITPLQSGTINIPPTQIKGDIKVAQTTKYDPFFDNFFSGAMLNQSNVKPFIATSNEVSILVQPPVDNKADWLPLESLKIEDLSDIPETNKVGEPITRIIKLSAIGGTAKSLPSLEKFNRIDKLKIYPKQPILNTKYDDENKKIYSSREETYTIIPEQEGSIVLPEISIFWWDVETNTSQNAILPAKTINVIGVAENITENSVNSEPESVVQEASNKNETKFITAEYIIIWLLILVLILFSIIIYLVFARNKPSPHKHSSKNYPNKLSKTINALQSLSETYKFVQSFATDNWQVPQNTSLNNIVKYLQNNNYSGNINNLEELFSKISSAVYQKNTVESVELSVVKNALLMELPKVKKAFNSKKSTFGRLNPT
jgi:hypothetical protein